MKKSLLCILLLSTHCGPIQPIRNPFAESHRPSPSGSSIAGNILRIIAIDVGQGDSTLVIGPSGQKLLIDAGPPEAGINKVIPLLKEIGVQSLDWILATHYDADHIGGIAEVMGNFIPRINVLDRGDNTDHDTSTFQNYLETTTPYRQEVQPGLELPLGEGAEAKIVVVNGRYSDGSEIHLNPDEENESCIGLLISYGDFRYFTAGDLTGGGSPGGFETKDMETHTGEIMGDIDILHVDHHGSSTSTNQNLLDLTTPENAIISVGKDNDFGHPTEEVLDRLERSGVHVYRTDQLGTIEIETDGNDYTIAPH